MPRDALTTRTGLILGAASVLLAVSTLGLTLRETPAAAYMPEYRCVEGSNEWTPPPAPDRMVLITQPDPLAGLPQECSLYISGLRELAQSSCPRLPADARNSILQAADQLVQTWQSMPDDAIEALTAACREAHHAIRNAIPQVCPQDIAR